MENDFELWRRSREGDAEAFACLFRRHARQIYNYCFRRIGDWTVAEDVVSIVFLEAWRSWVAPLVNGLPGFSHQYVTNGSSEAIRESVWSLLASAQSARPWKSRR